MQYVIMATLLTLIVIGMVVTVAVLVMLAGCG